MQVISVFMVLSLINQDIGTHVAASVVLNECVGVFR